MSRHHVNPETGIPSLCKAQVRSCPFGGPHYGSQAEAIRGNELREGALQTLKKLSRGKQAMEPSGLEGFSIYKEIPIQLKASDFTLSEGAVLDPQGPVFVRQGLLYPAKVMAYVDQLLEGLPITPIQVTDIVPGGGHWHLNGLHRLVAYRLLGLSTPAEIWR